MIEYSAREVPTATNLAQFGRSLWADLAGQAKLLDERVGTFSLFLKKLNFSLCFVPDIYSIFKHSPHSILYRSSSSNHLGQALF